MVVTVDLPGHGLSGIDREEWTVAGFGNDVVTVVEHLGLEDIILIGHSMGGPISLEAARQMPGRTRGVIGVDTFQDVESEWDPEQQEAMLQAMQSAGVPIRAVNATLWPTAPEVNRRYADFDAVLMEDVGHFLMQEAPEAFNRHLRTVIAEFETG